MKHFSLRLTARSPLAIRADHAPGGAAGARYIPGSTLLGGLATLYRQYYQGSEEMELFAPLFLQERVFYPDIYPAAFDDTGLHGQHSPVYPLPYTAQSCKRHTGFRFPENETNEAHGARDTLIDGALLRLAATDQQRLAILREGKYCHCQEPMDYFDGYYRRDQLDPAIMVAAQPERYSRLQTHTGIHRESGTVQDSILYNRQVFEEGMEFWGEVICPDDEQLVRGFTDFLAEIGPSGLLRLGTGRTRGMGRVTLAAEEMETEQDRCKLFKKRLEDFDAALRRRANYFKLDQPAHALFFALTLRSPLILCDALLRYRGVIDTSVLVELLDDLSLPGLELIYQAASMRRVTGWQEVWGTPRAAEFALDSGSVFLFGCSSPLDEKLREQLLDALFALEEKGAGRRRAEGFGRVSISDRFHQLVEQEEVAR